MLRDKAGPTSTSNSDLGSKQQCKWAETTKSHENLASISLSNVEDLSRWLLVLRLGGALVFVDAFIRWSHIVPRSAIEASPWTSTTIEAFLLVLYGCLAETIAFHVGIVTAYYIVSVVVDWVCFLFSGSKQAMSSIRREFQFSLIPLALFYSSLTKLFLLFLLTIWTPTSVPDGTTSKSSRSWVEKLWFQRELSYIRQMIDEDKIDREWIVRNVLGGMSAGFGLRVIIDFHPILTTAIIVGGWGAKTAMSTVVSQWVGGGETGEAWLAYSIP